MGGRGLGARAAEDLWVGVGVRVLVLITMAASCSIAITFLLRPRRRDANNPYRTRSRFSTDTFQTCDDVHLIVGVAVKLAWGACACASWDPKQ